MDSNNNDKIVWIVVAIAIIGIVTVVGCKLMMDRVTDQVIDRLQREYSPSPYSPGVDPDKISPEVLNQPQIASQLSGDEMNSQQNYRLFGDGGQVAKLGMWREDWERERGFGNLAH